ncbi:MAG: hypothetical protein JNL13_07285 [Chitinophagaceae bacterium]|nr:hypothetical protein [Chitinophagaceae bacterium]
MVLLLGAAGAAQAQKVSTRVVDNKGTIKWVLDSSTSVIINAKNGITKSGDSVKLGGTLTETTTIATSATQFLQLTGLQAGSRADSVLMINNTTGQIKRMSVADLVSSHAANGLTKNGDSIELGGILYKATSIATDGTKTLAITGLTSGSTSDSVVVVDATSGVLKRISLQNAVKAANGLRKSGDTVKLGGNLIEATKVTTSATNTLAIEGLQSGSLATDSLVVSDGTTGVLKRVSANTLLSSGEQKFTATAGLTTYTVPNLPADVTRVWVYRNGVKLLATTDYTVSGTTVTLNPGGTAPDDWAVLAGDKIEVQWVK